MVNSTVGCDLPLILRQCLGCLCTTVCAVVQPIYWIVGGGFAADMIQVLLQSTNVFSARTRVSGWMIVRQLGGVDVVCLLVKSKKNITTVDEMLGKLLVMMMMMHCDGLELIRCGVEEGGV